jgi:hypothetical protein
MFGVEGGELGMLGAGVVVVASGGAVGSASGVLGGRLQAEIRTDTPNTASNLL